MLLLLILISHPLMLYAAKVVVIESYHQGYLWDKEYYQAILDKLTPQHQVSHFEMDTKRLPKEHYTERAELAWQFIVEQQPQLVILADDNAVHYLHQRLNSRQIPVVYLGVNMNPRAYHLNEHKRFTGVLERPLLKRSLLLLERLLPQTKHRKILVLFDGGNTSKIAAEYISKQPSSMVSDIEVHILQLTQLVEWQQQVRSAKDHGYSAIVVALYHAVRDEDNQSVDANNLLEWISNNTPVPNFGFWGFSIYSKGNIGGYVLDGYQHGTLAADMAKRILAGEKPESIFPVTDDLGQYRFSHTGMKKWQLTLPKEIEKQTTWVD
ncbi:ABC transporter substrate-binding protein [Shewanella sp.]|uniref:ABC transporter substrate-binding protein n=1 Tax=Shewanella sp. TaxID=50422 RepID=UPI003A8C1FE4